MKILLKITAIAGLSLMGHQLMAQSPANNQVAANEGFSTSMGTGQLKIYNCLVAVLEGFDFGYKYDIVSYDAVLIKKNTQEAVTAKGRGPLFEKNRTVSEMIKEARPGDRLIFENIKVKGEGQPERFAKGSLSIAIR